MTEEKEEWDEVWKEALDSFDLVFTLFWPDVIADTEIGEGATPLEQELQKLTPDGNTGLLRVDKLFAIVARDSNDPRYAHIEMQAWKDMELPRRMFRYGIRAREHFHQPVGSFAILGDDDPKWKPDGYSEGVFGCEQGCAFRIVKLIEWRGRMEELEKGDNLFGLFVCAHLETMATRGKVSQRKEAKFRLLSNLMRRDIHADEIQCWYRLIDWIMKLPEDVNRTVWLQLKELKEGTAVPHVTYAEIYGREEGIKEGKKDGIKEGLRESLREALMVKFPDEGQAVAAEFTDEQNVERLKFLHRQAILAQSPDDFRTRIASE